jgi:hypothetical protein
VRWLILGPKAVKKLARELRTAARTRSQSGAYADNEKTMPYRGLSRDQPLIACRDPGLPRMKKPIFLAPLVVSLALGACEFATSAVAPSITGGGVGGQPIAIVPLDAAQLGQPVGARVAQLQSDLARLQQAGVRQVQRAIQLQADMDASVASYQIAVGTLRSGQPAGTAANSVGQWQHAQAQLRTVSATLDQMSGLSNDVAKNVAFAAFLLQSIREAGAAPNAVEQDRRQLGLLENSAGQTSASLDRLLGGLRQQVLSQSHFLGMEGAKLAQIAPPSGGAITGPITSAPLPPQPTASGHTAAPAGAGLASGRPFVVIRFDNPGVEYEQQLYEAVSAALARAPDVGFDLVAAAPGGGTAEEAVSNAEAARESMERVRSSLLNMGLPADRVSISQLTDPDIQGNEVRLYVR